MKINSSESKYELKKEKKRKCYVKMELKSNSKTNIIDNQNKLIQIRK